MMFFALLLNRTDGADVMLYPLLAQRQHRRRRIRFGEQCSGRKVHADIRGLRRQQHRDQQFER